MDRFQRDEHEERAHAEAPRLETIEFDDETLELVTLFQKAWKLKWTGVADTDVQHALFLMHTSLGRFCDLSVLKDAKIRHIISTVSSVPNLGETPRPASSVFTDAVEKPGWKSISRRSRSVKRPAVSGETRPDSMALCLTRS